MKIVNEKINLKMMKTKIFKIKIETRATITNYKIATINNQIIQMEINPITILIPPKIIINFKLKNLNRNYYSLTSYRTDFKNKSNILIKKHK